MAAPPDPQTARIRQGVALGVGLLVVILLVVGVKGCLSSAKKRALRDYNRDVASVIQRSDSEVSKPFFEALSGSSAAAGDTTNLATQVNQLKIVADDLVKQARKFDPPDDMKPAQRYLLDVLQLRAEALQKIADKIPTAQGNGNASETAVAQITGQMLKFLSSDILYSQRVVPYLKRALDRNDITGQTIPSSQFLPSIDWLDPSEVASRLGGTAPSGSRRRGPPAPGTHGQALTSVSVNGSELNSDEANRIQASPNTTFTVTFENQGENDEQGVIVRVEITGAGAPSKTQTTVPTTSAGSTATAEIPLRKTPPIGQPVEIKVTVEPVPGEVDPSNNSKTYPAIFTR